jgi:hypothetical protein
MMVFNFGEYFYNIEFNKNSIANVKYRDGKFEFYVNIIFNSKSNPHLFRNVFSNQRGIYSLTLPLENIYKFKYYLEEKKIFIPKSKNNEFKIFYNESVRISLKYYETSLYSIDITPHDKIIKITLPYVFYLIKYFPFYPQSLIYNHIVTEKFKVLENTTDIMCSLDKSFERTKHKNVLKDVKKLMSCVTLNRETMMARLDYTNFLPRNNILCIRGIGGIIMSYIH